jgi:ribosome maturation factor RimP
MIEKGILEGHLHEILDGTDAFLINVSVDKSNRIHVHVDKMDGITIEDCANISRDLEGRLDRESDDFSLEVSSPGLDAPFRVPEQYEKSIGKMVSVQCRDGEKILGVLKKSDQYGLLLEIPSEKKGEEPEVKKLDFSEITSTKIHIQF